ncbi:MAG: glycosyltransferase, partial [Candidatus Sumerlaeia bacterium]|nr:glycosyltransferase [Candidatus Sumerlaeia bacterium]
MPINQETNKSSLPFVSVIVPVFNEEKNIGSCIESLLNQDYPRERYEIIIVDNNSTDHTREIISRYPVTLLVEDKIRGSYAARNKGIEYAKGEILAFTDGDTRPAPDWLKNGVSAMQEEDLSYLGCRVEMYSDSAKLTYCDIYEMLISFDVQRWLNTLHFAPTCALLVRRSVFDATGKFDQRLFSGGDVEFGNRVWRNGFKQGYSSSAIVYHLTRSSFKDLMKRALRYGGGQAQL